MCVCVTFLSLSCLHLFLNTFSLLFGGEGSVGRGWDAKNPWTPPSPRPAHICDSKFKHHDPIHVMVLEIENQQGLHFVTVHLFSHRNISDIAKMQHVALFSSKQKKNKKTNKTDGGCIAANLFSFTNTFLFSCTAIFFDESFLVTVKPAGNSFHQPCEQNAIWPKGPRTLCLLGGETSAYCLSQKTRDSAYVHNYYFYSQTPHKSFLSTKGIYFFSLSGRINASH